jgi:glyoxylate reductase
MNGDSYLILCFSPLPPELVKALLSPYAKELDREVDVEVINDLSDWDRVIEVLGRADVIIGDYTFKVPVTSDMVEHMRKVRLIAQPTTGYDHIDIKACAERGIPVANIGGANAITVAEYTIMTALVLLRRMVEAHIRTARGEWPQWELMEKGSYELYEKTWGIVGLGRIGREVARRLSGFSVRVIYYDKVRAEEDLEKSLNVEYVPFPKLLKTSDIISIHVPLTEETRGLIGEKELRLMKPTAILINPARGEIVDEEALARALKEGWIFGAAVDVYSSEPPGREHPLIGLGDVNLVTTPHMAGASTESRTRIINVTIENVVRVLKGEKPVNVVNMEV